MYLSSLIPAIRVRQPLGLDQWDCHTALLVSGSQSLFTQHIRFNSGSPTLRFTKEIKTLFIPVIAKGVAGEEDKKSFKYDVCGKCPRV